MKTNGVRRVNSSPSALKRTLRKGYRRSTVNAAQTKAKDFDAVCAKEISIETRRRRLRVATDGEVTVMNTPLHYEVRAGALRVIVPATAESSST